MIKAIIFDMNGVIIDDEHIHELAFCETVKQYNINLSHWDYQNYCFGRTDKDGYKQIARKFSIKLPINKLAKQKSQKYLKLFPANKKAYPEVIDLIDSLAKQFILALTSSAIKREIDLVTKEFDIRDKFKVLISADDVTMGKPAPEPYLITVDKLNLEPQNCLVIEDSPNGILSAKSAGCYCIGITTTHTQEDLKKADIVVEKFSTITPKFIQNIGVQK